MSSAYCPNGHENPSGSRFCLHCGAPLSSPILGDRYRVDRELGRGGFGRTYLAQDTNRFDELCVLKEFAPQASGTQALDKARELFEREAGILYQLQHPQIPRFREMFRDRVAGESKLFLVQDYIEGPTYRQLLWERQQQGQTFSEAEVRRLLEQILPILAYIHDRGVVHRDISPENIIHRHADNFPVLIDFGGVKEMAARFASQLSPETAGTRLGKMGYAPDEQMQTGRVYSHSDLYALAATLLVLLTGKEPHDLIDPQMLEWKWRDRVQLSPQLGAIFDRMLARHPGDRFPSAQAVLDALNDPQKTPVPPTVPTVAPPSTFRPRRAISASQPWGKVVAIVLSIVPIVGVIWGLVNIVGQVSDRNSVETPTNRSNYSREEQQRKTEIRDRRQELGIDRKFFIQLVDRDFYQTYPEQQGRTLSTTKEDEIWRQRWDEMAEKWLDRLSELSPSSRQQLGSYTRSDLNDLKNRVNQLNLSSRALNDLNDARFFNWFPQQEGQNFIDEPIGQIWYAIAHENVDRLESGSALETIQFGSGETSTAMSDTLEPGGGKAYIADLERGQFAEVYLDADTDAILLSVYTPKGQVLLADSTQNTLSVNLPESGYYEFIVVANSNSPASYRLELAVKR